MEENFKEDADKDEISLIDLFVTLLKHRKLIITMIICGIICASGAYVYLRNKQNRQPAANTGSQAIAAGAEGRIGIALNTQAPAFMREGLQSWFYSPELIYDAMREAGFEYLNLDALKVSLPSGGNNQISLNDPAQREQVLFIINRRFISNQKLDGTAFTNNEKVFELFPRTEYSIEILFRYGDPAKMDAFLRAYIQRAEQLISGYYRPYAENMIAYFEANKNNLTMDEYVQYRWAGKFLDGKEKILSETFPPVAAVLSGTAAPQSGGVSPKVSALIIVIAFIFCAIFLAFCVEAVENIKKDDSVRAKIRAALGKV